MTAAEMINARVQEFLAQMSSGKLDWTAEELVSYFLEPKKDSAEMTYPEFALGPTDPARAKLVAKVVAGLRGVEMHKGENGQGFRFSGPGATVPAPVVVEKIVEKIVEVAAKPGGELKTPVIFPDRPVVPVPNPKFIAAPFYKMMSAALDAGKHLAIAGPRASASPRPRSSTSSRRASPS